MDRNAYNLLVKVTDSFKHVGWINGLSEKQYDTLNAALEYIQRVQNMRDRKSQHPSIAKRLKKKGHTVREIAEILGYKHPGSVSHLLSKNNG